MAWSSAYLPWRRGLIGINTSQLFSCVSGLTVGVVSREEEWSLWLADRKHGGSKERVCLEVEAGAGYDKAS